MAARKRPPVKQLTAQEQKEDLENLLVFGYECKLFRDDEKAEYIEHEKHLIPWMGDNTVMIDRYDGRGYLHDLRPHDADLNRHKNGALSGEEQAVENACDEERYLEINTDYMERELYEEEEMKRLHEELGDHSFGAVGFSYDQSQGQQAYQPEEPEAENEEEYFIPPPELQVPYEMKLPDHEKTNAIVMKTAKCISEHGMQMEIIIKTKQKDNPQFHFLDCDSQLYPYYRHAVQMIKSGRYRPSLVEPKRRRSQHESVTEEDEYYLHPSLVKTTSSSEDFLTEDILAIISAKLPGSRITDTPYARLVEKMKKSSSWSPLHRAVPSSHTSSPEDEPAPSHTEEEVVTPLAPPPLPPLAIFTNQEPHKGHRCLPPVPGVEPVILPPRRWDAPPPRGTPPPRETQPHRDPAPHRETQPNRDTQRYGDTQPDRESPPHKHREPEDHDSHMERLPPPDLRPIIDKMALYVAKNGPEFEIVVKSKNDKRFDFLQSWHKHFPYYHEQKMDRLKEIKEASSSTHGDDDEYDNDDDSHSKEQNQLKSISFSIRNKDTDAVSIGGRGVLLGYDSSEEESSGEKEQEGESKYDVTTVTPEEGTTSDKTSDKTPQTSEQQEKKQVEERLRDKLTSAARDKLAAAAKEKQLQAERKRKAAMFITMLKGGPASAAQGTTESQLAAESGADNTAPSMPGDYSDPAFGYYPTELQSPDVSHSTHRSGSPTQNQSPDDASRLNRHSRSPVNRHRSRRRRGRWSPMRRSRSPVKRKRGKTPPSSYSIVRRSLSKSPTRNKKSRSQSPHRSKRARPTSPSQLSKSTSKGKTSLRPGSKSHRRSRSNSKSRILKKRSRSKSKNTKEGSVSKALPSKSKKRRSRSNSRSKRSTKSPSRSKKHKRPLSKSPSKRKRSRSKSPSRHKSKKHSHSKSKKKSYSKHKSKSRSKKDASKPKRSSSTSEESSKSEQLSRSKQPSPSRSTSKHRSRSASKQPTPSKSDQPTPSKPEQLTSPRSPSKQRSKSRSRSPSKQPSPSRSTSSTSSRSLSPSGTVDSQVESKRSASQSPPSEALSQSEDENQDHKKEEGDGWLMKSPPDSPDVVSLNGKHKEALSREATDGDESNDSDVIIIGEDSAPQRPFSVAPPSRFGGTDAKTYSDTPVSNDLLMKVRAMLKASRQETT